MLRESSLGRLEWADAIASMVSSPPSSDSMIPLKARPTMTSYLRDNVNLYGVERVVIAGPDGTEPVSVGWTGK
jgi:hypothetical protein